MRVCQSSSIELGIVFRTEEISHRVEAVSRLCAPSNLELRAGTNSMPFRHKYIRSLFVIIILLDNMEKPTMYICSSMHAPFLLPSLSARFVHVATES